MQVQLSKDPRDIPSPVCGDTRSLDDGSDNFFLRIGVATWMGGLYSGSSAEPGGKGFLMIRSILLYKLSSPKYNLVVSLNKGTPMWPQNTIALIMGTPKWNP